MTAAAVGLALGKAALAKPLSSRTAAMAAAAVAMAQAV